MGPTGKAAAACTAEAAKPVRQLSHGTLRNATKTVVGTVGNRALEGLDAPTPH